VSEERRHSKHGYSNPPEYENRYQPDRPNGVPWHIIYEIKDSIGQVNTTLARLDERIANLVIRSTENNQAVDQLKLELDHLPTKSGLYAAITIAVAVLGLFIGIYWNSVSSKFEAVDAKFQTVNARIDGVLQRLH
jgi:uncharacterized protein YoxC